MRAKTPQGIKLFGITLEIFILSLFPLVLDLQHPVKNSFSHHSGQVDRGEGGNSSVKACKNVHKIALILNILYLAKVIEAASP